MNDLIKWNGDVGVEEASGISKRKVWWIPLSSGLASRAVEVSVILEGDRVLDHFVKFGYPKLTYTREKEAYAKALFEAGIWLGEMKARDKSKPQ